MEEVPEFFETCRDFILDKLDEFEGVKVYGSELSLDLTEQMNADGTFTMSCEKSKRYLQGWLWEAGKYLEFEKSNFGERSNPFKNVDAFIVRMITEGVRIILSRCKFMKDNMDKEFELTEDIISTIKEQVVDQTDEELF